MVFLRLATILIVFLSLLSFHPIPSQTSSSNGTEFTPEEALPELPPGATVVLPVPQRRSKEKAAINGIFLKRTEASADQTVWTVSTETVSPGAPASSAIGFVVPQLPRGSYEAWYESKADNTKLSSMKFTIVPRLLAEVGIIRSEPGTEVEVKARIPIPQVRKRNGEPGELNAFARLTSRHPSVAQVITDGLQKIGSDGSVVWKVRIVSSGIAEVEASGDGFEPAVMNVVGMPGPGATFQEAQLALLKEQVRYAQSAEVSAEARSKTLEAEIRRKEGSSPSSGEFSVRQPEIARLEARRDIAVGDVEKFRQHSNEATIFINQISPQQPPSINEDALKPGDVLLVLGSSPIISDKIRQYDGEQLGRAGEYSHASLYVGVINGKKMVAEMWASGYWITPLNVSTKGSRIVDVFRRYGIDEGRRDVIASRGKTIFGNPQNFVRQNSPWFFSWGSGLPYAYEEIKVLALAAWGTPAWFVETFVTNKVDQPAGGRRKMICSEFVAWIYQDVGLPLNVQYWKSLTDAHIFTSDDRRRDYTTPNMIAASNDLTRVGRFLGP